MRGDVAATPQLRLGPVPLCQAALIGTHDAAHACMPEQPLPHSPPTADGRAAAAPADATARGVTGKHASNMKHMHATCTLSAPLRSCVVGPRAARPSTTRQPPRRALTRTPADAALRAVVNHVSHASYPMHAPVPVPVLSFRPLISLMASSVAETKQAGWLRRVAPETLCIISVISIRIIILLIFLWLLVFRLAWLCCVLLRCCLRVLCCLRDIGRFWRRRRRRRWHWHGSWHWRRGRGWGGRGVCGGRPVAACSVLITRRRRRLNDRSSNRAWRVCGGRSQERERNQRSTQHAHQRPGPGRLHGRAGMCAERSAGEGGGRKGGSYTCGSVGEQECAVRSSSRARRARQAVLAMLCAVRLFGSCNMHIISAGPYQVGRGVSANGRHACHGSKLLSRSVRHDHAGCCTACYAELREWCAGYRKRMVLGGGGPWVGHKVVPLQLRAEKAVLHGRGNCAGTMLVSEAERVCRKPWCCREHVCRHNSAAVACSAPGGMPLITWMLQLSGEYR